MTLGETKYTVPLFDLRKILVFGEAKAIFAATPSFAIFDNPEN